MQGLTKYINRHAIIQKIHDKISNSIENTTTVGFPVI